MTTRDTSQSPSIGVIGIGRMGAPIATMLSARFPVAAFDVDQRRRALVPGPRWASSVQDLCETVDVVVTALPGPGELRRCVAEALPHMRPGVLWLDLTSSDPVVTRELAGEARRREVQVVSAPMGGSTAEAAEGSLSFFVSGSDEAVARAVPLLEALARPGGVRRAGSRAEDGQIVKLLANGLWFAQAVATAEAMLIGQGLGIGPAALHELLRDSAGGSRFLDEHASRLLDGDYLESFGIDRVVEELDTIRAMGEHAGVPTPVLDSSARIHREALERFGPQLGELLAVKLLEEHAGRRLRR